MNRYGSHLRRLAQWTVLVLVSVVLLSTNSSAQDTPLNPPEIYLGAYVNPEGQGESVTEVGELESSMNRTLAVSVHHYEWIELGEKFPSPLEKDDLAKGRVPVVSWNCGVPNAVVASGSADSVIIAAARAIQAYGGPVLIRYMEAMNLPDTDNNRTACHGPGDNADGHFSPQDFIAAWDHIRKVFTCPNLAGPCQPVTNVAWLWNPGGKGAPFAAYYPGDSEVTWVGIDAFDYQQPSAEDQFFETINPVYSALTSVAGSKPILLETAALQGNQAAYLSADAAVRDLQNNFPGINGLIYYDAERYGFDWSLDNHGGFSAFTILGPVPYMSAVVRLNKPGTPPPLCCDRSN